MAVGREDYLDQLQALMPQGRAWPRDSGAVLTRLLDAVAGSLARADAAAEDLMSEILPTTAVALLSDWERVLGLPDPCSSLSSEISKRREAAVVKLIRSHAPTPEAMVAMAQGLGYEPEVIEHQQAAAARIPRLDTSAGRWRHVWWMRVKTSDTRYFDALSNVLTPLAIRAPDSELECRVRAAAPAHTYPVFVYAPSLGGPLR